MTKRLRWGLLSTSRINRALMDPIRRAERSELYAVASRDGARARAYAQEWEIPHFHSSYEALLEDPNVDVIYNALPNGMHAEWTIKAARAGKHVLCEKPVVVSLNEMDRVEAAARENHVTVFEAFMYLHHPQTLKVREMVESGRIGSLQTIHTWFAFYLAPGNDIRLQPGLAGGAAWDVGVYPNSLSITLAGGKAPAEVWAQQLVDNGVDVAMRAQLNFGNGVVSQVTSGFRSPFGEGAWIIGDAGIIHLAEPWKPGMADKESRITLTDRDDCTETLVFDPCDPYDCEVAAMEACVLDGAAPLVPLSLSREFLRTMLAMFESARTGKVVAP